ncbi:MAG: hypothetical protein ABI597_07405 [Gammaproteobacteria bacterium]
MTSLHIHNFLDAMLSEIKNFENASKSYGVVLLLSSKFRKEIARMLAEDIRANPLYKDITQPVNVFAKSASKGKVP